MLDSPHSGRNYPADFDYSCLLNDLRKAEDSYVDEIFDKAPALGGPLLCARIPRAYIDVNRNITDIDPLLLDSPWQGPIAPSNRSAAGFGLVHRLVRPGMPVYGRRLSQGEIQKRIDRYYTPYHSVLSALLDDAVFLFGCALHLNLHSMPSCGGTRTADIVLGDRDGTTCGRDYLYMVRDNLIRMGYRVALNDPYKGMEILRRHSAPRKGRHSLQIEISKHLYMNEKTLEKTENFVRLKSDMTDFIARCITDLQTQQTFPLAAD